MAISGDIKALIQANNGDVLAGTNSSANIYRSTDNGQNFSLVVALGSSSDAVNALTIVKSTGYLLAAVSGSASASGIWRSVDNGSNWTRVKTHPSNTGYLDITAIQGGSRIGAVGFETSFPYSPVIYSSDQGSTWQDISVGYYNQKHLSIAAYDDNLLFHAYQGEPYGGVYAFYGTDTYYTATGGIIVNPPTAAGFSTVGGGAGNGGLDMVSFLIKDSGGQYRRRALWAVKDAANTANTALWQWPATPTGPYSFAKLATVTAENFNAMYVDPAFVYTAIGAERTIWAGANGKIYVSYNSGLSWAVATSSPSGQIYSFVRTSSGVLIAGGASGEIFLFGGSGSTGGGTGEDDEEDPPPPPEETGTLTAQFLGRTATCEDEVYVANKFSFSNITHLFHYNGSTYTNLQYGSSPPYEFLGTSAVVNKAAYFGSATAIADLPGGTFSSLVFDLSQEASNITVVWEYWNGSSWASLTTQDNTEALRNPGVNSVSWQIPSGWATTSVNSVTGYWIRARITVVASSPQTPIQSNRYIYTTLLPYIDVAATEVTGDIVANGRIKWTNQTGLDVERTVVGLRSLDRGQNFNAYINISDTQAPFGMTIAKGSEAGVSWQDSNKTATARSLLLSYSSGGDLNSWNDLATVTLDSTVARDYYGYYRAFVRCYYNNASAQVWNLRIKISFGSGGSRWYGKAVYPNTLADWETVDLGQVAIPTTQISYQSGSLSDQLQLTIQGYCTSTSKPLTLYDLVLIPIDEWGIDTKIPELVTSGSPQIVNNNYLEIDSISNPKIAISALHRNPTGLIVSRYQTVNNGPVIFQTNRNQRLWFLNMSYENYWRSYPEIMGSVQLFKQQQYLGYRGRT